MLNIFRLNRCTFKIDILYNIIIIIFENPIEFYTYYYSKDTNRIFFNPSKNFVMGNSFVIITCYACNLKKDVCKLFKHSKSS